MVATGDALICELAASEPFGDYVSRFPDASRDAGDMLRVAVGIGVVDRYQELLKLAIERKRPVSDKEWHELCARVSWPRPLPEWDREKREPIVIDGHGRFDFGEPFKLPWWLRDDVPPKRDLALWRKSAVKVGAITFCVAIVGLALPSPDTFDFWIAMAALVVALIAATL